MTEHLTLYSHPLSLCGGQMNAGLLGQVHQLDQVPCRPVEAVVVPGYDDISRTRPNELDHAPPALTASRHLAALNDAELRRRRVLLRDDLHNRPAVPAASRPATTRNWPKVRPVWPWPWPCRTLDGTDACAAGDTPIRMLTGTPVRADQVRNGPRTGVAGAGGNGDVHP